MKIKVERDLLKVFGVGMNNYDVKDDTLTRIKWIARLFCKMSIENYCGWRVSFMEEDGGAYIRYPQSGYYEGKSLKETIDKAWIDSRIDGKIRSVLRYRNENYKESDEELGIVNLGAAD